ncbi:hypothetical protein PF005_g20844 [Phytophthora fragariae]|uniref:Uncharacterized protein n=1 Tax=Phytophthora fragariae TaxID=53985 RepID=A0A6A3WK76_9STRA|nr:hypothetical protein PF011_g19638 [Phytophthora fragariae]KAE9186451.1 hypothetical protein PF005_g20844 [Phytophthora fragariae]
MSADERSTRDSIWNITPSALTCEKTVKLKRQLRLDLAQPKTDTSWRLRPWGRAAVVQRESQLRSGTATSSPTAA